MQKTLSVVDLRAIRENALKIKDGLGGRKFFAVVKADAYGHGAAEVARYIEDIADCFCVAITDEGVALRVSGVTKPVLVFTPPLGKDDVKRAEFYNLSVSVNSAECAVLCKGLNCHIKVNTGMNRLGCNLSELPAVLERLDPEKIEGIYSHLYAPESLERSLKQLAVFNEAEAIVRAKVPHICAHIAASGGFLRGGGFLKDGARCGILLYGYAPEGFSAYGYKGALKVYARRTQKTEFMGGGVGYSPATENYKTLCSYRLGYADGFRRTVPLGEKNLCMDAFIKNGGEQTECVFDNADAYAKRCGTISYEALTSVTRRSEIIYER